MQKLAIIGASDLGNLIAHYIISDNDFDFVGFYDNKKSDVEFGRYLGGTEKLEADFAAGLFDCVLIGIGYKNFFFRKHFFDVCNRLKINLPVFIHPSSFVDKTVKLGKGVIILPGCTVDRNVELEDNVFLNIACTVAHDTKIGSHTFLAPAVNIAGYVSIKERNFIGIGSNIINNITIAEDSIIGGGAVVIKNVSAKSVIVGNPGRLL